MYRATRSSALLLGAAAWAAVAGAAGIAHAQETEGRSSDAQWNDARALELIERVIEHRTAPGGISTLESFTARADGHVYFYLDRTDTDERTLVKADQVALELLWRAPDHTKQRIVGQREVDRLPNRMYYHIDHLTVVLNEFGDEIRMGEGDEVRAVPHPAARGGRTLYDYRLVDSLTLRFPEGREPLHLLRLDVRPKRFERPGVIGSIFIDRASAEIVRMSFTFTPASYVDPRLDYIRVSLDNGLWDGRHWLPHEQRIEIRRQVPQLDFPAGGVIRGVFRIGDYELNPPLSQRLFRGPRVIALPEPQRERHVFEDDIYAGLEEGDDGMAARPTSEIGDVAERAGSIVRDRYLSGLPRLRVHLRGASSAVRYNRAEGIFLGIGGTYAVDDATALDATIGHAFAADHWPMAVETRRRSDGASATAIALRLERHALRDLGPRAGAAGAINTVHAAFAARDFLDPYFATGAAVRVERRVAGRWRGRIGLTLERHRSAPSTGTSAPLDDAEAFERPIRAVDDGTFGIVRIGIDRSVAAVRDRDWTAGLSVEAGRPVDGGDGTYVRPIVEADAVLGAADSGVEASLDATAGAAFGAVPAQRLFLLGGRATLPGHAYRRFVGDRFALARLSASHPLIGPWVRLRLLTAAGWTELDGAEPPADWGAGPTGGLRASAGVGLGLVHDILRIDALRGLDGGEWVLVISADPSLWDLL
ncbi:MAG: hypothetical protein ACODAE_09795 [Gemmatimonadota bacterium]